MFINSKYIPETWLELGRSFAKKSNILSFDIEENIKTQFHFWMKD